MPMIEGDKFKLCGCCIVLLANGDSSGCAYNCPGDHESLLLSKLPVGPHPHDIIAPTEPFEDHGGFTCDGCEHVAHGNGHGAVQLLHVPDLTDLDDVVRHVTS